MRNFKKIISGLSATAILISTIAPMNVFADSTQIENNRIKLYGNTKCAEEGHTVCLDIWAQGKTISDLRLAKQKDFADIIVYRNETKSGDKGYYEITFSLADRKSGLYDAYIACDCGEEIVKETVVHSNPEESKDAIVLLNNAVKAENPVSEIKKICDEYSFALGFISEYELDDYAAELMCEYIKASALNPENKEDAIALYEKAVAISAIKSKKLTNFIDAEKELQLDSSELSEYYKKDYVSEAAGAYITGNIFDESINSIKEFDEELCEEFVLGIVKKADGWGAVVDVVNGFSSEIGVSDISKEKALKVMNREYGSYKELKDALTAKPQTSGGSGGGGGGGRGSSAGLGGGAEYTEEYVNTDEVEKINKNIFDDIDDVVWAVEPIVELAQQGIISGKADRLFYPNDNITREEVVKIIVLSMFKNAEKADISFADVDDNEWYAGFVKQACGVGVINGIGENLFGTGMNITREDMAVIAYRAAVEAGKITDAQRTKEFIFEDDSEISDYAKEAVYMLYDADIINGMGAEIFAPKEALTRAQAAKIIYYIYSM